MRILPRSTARTFICHRLWRLWNVLKGGNAEFSIDTHGEELPLTPTLGGLPRLFFGSPDEVVDVPVTTAVEVEGAGASAGFLFLLPLGRPRPRLTGTAGEESGSARGQGRGGASVRISISGADGNRLTMFLALCRFRSVDFFGQGLRWRRRDGRHRVTGRDGRRRKGERKRSFIRTEDIYINIYTWTVTPKNRIA